MNKKESYQLVQKVLENYFNKELFVQFAKELFNKIDESKAFHVRGDVKEAYKWLVKTYERIATFTDHDDNKIDILIVYLQKQDSLDRARSAQRNFVADYLKNRDEKEAALVAFVTPNISDWRLSLVKMDYKFEETQAGRKKLKEKFTPARRWSFLVGPNENSHTAQSKLAPILQNEDNPTLADLEEAFNIETVTKEFFEKYRGLFNETFDALEKVIKKDHKIKANFENNGVETADFCKKLLGQIVFLYFLQKKGWFGVAMDKEWGDGDKKYLRSLFERAKAKDKNYFNDYLEPLFYEALAIKRDDDFYSRFNCKIPFLNGGLFDPINNYSWATTKIELPNKLFSNNNETKQGDIGDGILDIFDRYNFTVKEDEPLEKEVAIDPEMLGKVFENLLEVKDRKSKGTYYTPREIVHYMCEQSLINYLATELEGKVIKDDIEKFIRLGEKISEHEATAIAKSEANPEYQGDYQEELPPSIAKYANEIDEKLSAIKVCDPAVGSGAFPVGMMNEIVKARNFLSNYIKDGQRNIYNFKRECIENSLYGVDIDPGAVEIAKLRLWLSLIVDEQDFKEIKPLPNLDYKIMQGNSLLEEYEGIKLFDERIILSHTENVEEKIKKIKLRQSEIQKEYFALHSNGKLSPVKKLEIETESKNIEKQIKELEKFEANKAAKAGLFDIFKESQKKAEHLQQLQKQFFAITSREEKKVLKSKIDELEWELVEVTLREEGKSKELKKIEEFKKTNIKPFFLWKLHFSDVFKEKGGFNVVIANPPYISYGLRGGQKITTEEKETLRRTFPDSAEYKISMYALFIDRAIQLSKLDGGVQTFIVPDSFLLGRYFSKIRSSILINNEIHHILLLPYSVFEATVGFSVVYCFQRKVTINPDHILTAKFATNNEQISRGDYVRFSYPQSYFKHTKYNRFRLFFSKETLELINKIEKGSCELSEFMTGRTGVRSLIGQKQIVSKEKKAKTWCPGLISGSQIKKYRIFYEGDFINIDPKKLCSGGWDYDVIHNIKLLLRQTGDSITAAVDTNGYYHLNNIHSFALNNEKLDILFLLAILNSRLIDVYYKIISLEANRVMAQTDIETIESLPIKEISKSEQKPFIEIVDKIISITKDKDYLENQAKQDKVKKYEEQIDKMVYELYELTEEEIKIVEENSK